LGLSVPQAADTVSIVKQWAFAKQARSLPLAALTFYEYREP
jgi:hypothetical protein